MAMRPGNKTPPQRSKTSKTSPASLSLPVSLPRLEVGQDTCYNRTSLGTTFTNSSLQAMRASMDDPLLRKVQRSTWESRRRHPMLTVGILLLPRHQESSPGKPVSPLLGQTHGRLEGRQHHSHRKQPDPSLGRLKQQHIRLPLLLTMPCQLHPHQQQQPSSLDHNILDRRFLVRLQRLRQQQRRRVRGTVLIRRSARSRLKPQ